MDDQSRQPEAIDLAAAAEQLLHALRVRQRRRRLDGAPVVITALAIAVHFGLRPRGNRDSRRRGARHVVAHLRAAGHQVLANDHGYYLPNDAADLVVYARHRQARGLSELGAAGLAKRSPELADAQGQLALFPTQSRRPTTDQ